MSFDAELRDKIAAALEPLGIPVWLGRAPTDAPLPKASLYRVSARFLGADDAPTLREDRFQLSIFHAAADEVDEAAEALRGVVGLDEVSLVAQYPDELDDVVVSVVDFVAVRA